MADQQEELLLRQQLMKTDEVYVYKIPPLKTAGGHRAEDWNLAEPLATCQLVVERRGDQIVLDFYRGDTIFCTTTATYDPAVPLSTFVQDVADSSRYFVIKIMKEQKQATIGFGFRERDAAVDLREALQHYEKAMRRERDSASSSNGTIKAAAKSIPTLDKDEKIHVNLGGSKKSTTVKTKSAEGRSNKSVLLKKPPPPASPESGAKPSVTDTAAAIAAGPSVSKITVNLDAVQLDDHDDSAHDDSEVAVFTGTDEQWATEFDMPKQTTS